ncbi:hypothetical protein [Teredinibacter sp. KSP-S5-2]|uniref:hypothetical protein n=1 Tax=Teredinibacter sp. KSP-S5-2 TaxID=3034506 RepID=UPI0029343135|nr:hypothetical protein [Teredinibacter sp. KSP-S5-2]WNO10232.1 hypothetical protein P5V12_03500 [Teredinibacter sp. KSP-S5-2]
MINILLVGFLIVVICFVPVMLAAKKLDAGKSDLVSSVIAVIVGGIASSTIAPMLPGANTNALVATLYVFLITGAAYKFILDTTYVKGIIIALIPAAIWYVLGIVFS